MKGGEIAMENQTPVPAGTCTWRTTRPRARDPRRGRATAASPQPATVVRSGAPSGARSSRSARGWPASRSLGWPGPAEGRASPPRQEIHRCPRVAHELKASYAFIERNFFLTRRYWGWEVAFLVYSVAGALSISLIGADQGSPRLILTADGRARSSGTTSRWSSAGSPRRSRRALGGHARVHDDGADPALVAPARLGRSTRWSTA